MPPRISHFTILNKDQERNKDMDKQTTITIISCVISAVTLFITMLGVAYHFGGKNERAKADRVIGRMERENAAINSTLERQHREEINYKDKIINEKEKELHELREKYLLLLNERGAPANNSP